MRLGDNTKVKDKSESFYSGIRLTLGVCSAIHFALAFIFFYIAIYVLCIYNILSALLYIYMTLTLGEKHMRIYMILSYCEVLILVILTNLLLGWYSGFQFYIVALVPIAYYLFYLYSTIKYEPFVLCSIAYSIFIIILLRQCFCPATPMFVVEEYVLHIFFYCNLFIMVTMISIATTLFTKAVIVSQSRLEEMGYYDFLTKLLNRRKMLNVLEHKKDEDFFLILGDIDDFKRINDTYGHKTGDVVLQSVATVLSCHTRNEQAVSRWGGEEFLIFIAEQDKAYVLEMAERMRYAIENMKIPCKESFVHLTMTFGVVSSKEADNLEELIMICDQRLYEGKESGKNSVISF